MVSLKRQNFLITAAGDRGSKGENFLTQDIILSDEVELTGEVELIDDLCVKNEKQDQIETVLTQCDRWTGEKT